MAEETSELAERGNEIFERVVRPHVDVEKEAQKFVAIDVDSEEFEVDSNQRAALDGLLERRPDARGRIFFRRVGSRFAHRIGGRLQEGDPE